MDIEVCEKCGMDRCLLFFLKKRHVDDNRKVFLCENRNDSSIQLYGYEGALHLSMKCKGSLDCVMEKKDGEFKVLYATSQNLNLEEYRISDNLIGSCESYVEQTVSALSAKEG